jgi:flagellar M-ring protein FliF
MIDQLQLLLRQLTTSQKIGIGFGALASAVALVIFVIFAGRPDMQPAFTRLSTADAAAISAALRTAKISFQVADAGATILVPSTALADARVAAAAAGVSVDGAPKGFDLFDQSGFGMSEFQQQVTFQRALEGKLTGTIQAMEGVEHATVSIVAAQSGVLVGQDRPASASVVVQMRNGQPPGAAMVHGIGSTVASAVAGLTPDNVTVVDQSGRLLAGPQSDVTGDELTMQQSVERQLDAKIQALVDRALGAGHASVAVSATLDMDKVEQTVTTVRPIDQANWTPTSVQTIDERYGGSDLTGSGGIPGALSNIPGLLTYPSPAPGASPTPGASPNPSATPQLGYVKSQQTVNYNNSQTVERVIKAPGAIQRLSVAVLLDQAALGSVTPDALKATIEAAIGVDATRGDVVSVSAVSFAALPEAAGRSIVDDVVGTAGGLAGTAVGAAVAFMLLFLVRRNLRVLRGRVEEMQLATVTRVGTGLLAAQASGGGDNPLASVAALEQSPQARVQERLRMVAEKRPDAIVGLMNEWLHEEDRR